MKLPLLIHRLKMRVKSGLPKPLLAAIRPAFRSSRRALCRLRRFLVGEASVGAGWPGTRQDFNDFWGEATTAEVYDEQARFKLDDVVLQMLPDGVGSLLDIGCGSGRFLGRLARMPRGGAIRLWGLDFSDAAVNLARSVVPQATFVCTSADKLPFRDGVFDATVCLETLEHIRGPEGVVSEAMRVLIPGGILIISVPDGEHDDTVCHVNFWNRESLSQLLGAYGATRVMGVGSSNLVACVQKPACGRYR
ncbi:MAG TPA: methyltransferase domain-containing protein [Planctomycetota bacterium]|nr:methyltransferase domain-containing protein [Planctomycetota bacterium]